MNIEFVMTAQHVLILTSMSILEQFKAALCHEILVSTNMVGGKKLLALLAFLILLTLTIVILFYSTRISSYSFISYQNADGSPQKANAVILALARDSELEGLRNSIRSLEEKFNHVYQYPYLILNEVPFTDKFKEAITNLTKAEVKFDLIPKEHWSLPDWIDPVKFEESLERMKNEHVLHGELSSYHHMCRYDAYPFYFLIASYSARVSLPSSSVNRWQSGFFYRHPSILPYEWYWRLEPDVYFPCKIDFDPFLHLQDNNEKYGFTISLGESPNTIPTLWQTTLDFMNEHKDLIPAQRSRAWNFLTKTGGATYDLCHFWSNFEIGSLEFFRSKAYGAYFDYLDKKGGFFYERWGDAPVHSIAVSISPTTSMDVHYSFTHNTVTFLQLGMLLEKEEIHFFGRWFFFFFFNSLFDHFDTNIEISCLSQPADEIGYYHGGSIHCPAAREDLKHKCDCDPNEDIGVKSWGWSCTAFWQSL